MILETLLVDVVTAQIVYSFLSDTDIYKFKSFMYDIDTLSYTPSELLCLLKLHDPILLSKLEKIFSCLYPSEEVVDDEE